MHMVENYRMFFEYFVPPQVRLPNCCGLTKKKRVTFFVFVLFVGPQ